MKADSLTRIRHKGVTLPEIEFLVSQYNGVEYLRRTLSSIRLFHPHSRIVVASSTRCKQKSLARELISDFGAEQILVDHGHPNAIKALVENVTPGKFHCILDQDCELLSDLTCVALEMLETNLLWYAPEDRMILRGRAKTCCAVPYIRNTPGVGHISLLLLAQSCDRLEDLYSNPAHIDYPRFCHQREFYHQFFISRNHQGRFFGTQYAGSGTAFFYYWHFRPIALHHWFSSRYFEDTPKSVTEAGKVWGIYDVRLMNFEGGFSAPALGGLRANVRLVTSSILCRASLLKRRLKSAAKHLW